MFNRRFFRCTVALMVLFLVVVGYWVYKNHLELRELLRDHVAFGKIFLDPKISQHSLDKEEQLQAAASKSPKGEPFSAATGKPVKIQYAQVSSNPDDDRDAQLVSTETYYVKDLVPQLIEGPDGQVHKIYWHSKLKPGDFVPPPEAWPVMTRVLIDGVMYDVPEGETADSYINKIHLSSMYDVPIEDVGRLIAEGLIPSSFVNARVDPLPAPMRSDSAAGAGSFEDSPADSGVFPVINAPKIPVDKAPGTDEVERVHETLPVEGHEVRGWEGMSPEQQEKAQQLINQYGAEEGLRRFREMDPEAARQFERHPPISPRKQGENKVPARERPDEVESSTQ